MATVTSILARGGRVPARTTPKVPVKPPTPDTIKQALEVALGALRAESLARLQAVQADLATARQDVARALRETTEARTRAEELQGRVDAVLADSAQLRADLAVARQHCTDLEARCDELTAVSSDRHTALLAALARPGKTDIPVSGTPPSYQIVPQGRDPNGRATGYDLIPKGT